MFFADLNVRLVQTSAVYFSKTSKTIFFSFISTLDLSLIGIKLVIQLKLCEILPLTKYILIIVLFLHPPWAIQCQAL